ncbi:MAG: energy transducer TonB [Flavobacteriales bacterium]|nr:energy transducer TonB [Flavobacteriales bacterium]
MRRLFSTALLAATVLSSAAQEDVPPPPPPPPAGEVPVQTVQAPVTIAEEHPVYPGGDAGLNKALVANLKYPKDALEAGLSGTVYVQYVVGVDGAVRDVKVKRGVHPLLDKAAVKAVQALPPYSSPAKNGGVPVPYQLVLPVRFKPE